MRVMVKVTVTAEIHAPDQQTAMLVVNTAIEDAFSNLIEAGVNIPSFSTEADSKQLFDA